ncbi:FKBP-type peptidyl-prolyl cis-trans isomerase [Parathalassolituus penaei]|uniref:Peptidyl-prolyl cis-trans isomerase n=1 Tax=Parathalassolituus penaei TaxID=2997323 RepID=A0A9X3IRM9_9GAMM|nr:peptidylprolyl isomerase [Parathalassolituus penaei]MCY0964400.1 peptidylprolyl isomerase [Parathalassolituus penaei]
MTAEIRNGSQVRFHFALKLTDGQIIDSTFESEPAAMTVGDGNLPENFESCLHGLSAGAHETFSVPPEQAFGQHNPNNVQRMKRSDFAADMPIAPGLVVSFADAQNTELPGVIAGVDGNWVEVDFNHPLAGKTLQFEVQILEVVNAD